MVSLKAQQSIEFVVVVAAAVVAAVVDVDDEKYLVKLCH